MQERRERISRVNDEVASEGTRMVSEGGPAIPGEPAGPDSVASVRWETYDATAARERTANTLIQAIYFVFGIIEGLLGIRIALRLLAANPQNAFADFVYGITGPFVAPFAGIFATPAGNGYVLELHSILALVIYALLAYLLASLVRLLLRSVPGGYHHQRTTHLVH